MSAWRPGPGWLFLAAALALRAGWVLWRWAAAGPELSYDDEHLHWQLASHLVHDGTLVTDDGRLAARMPLYPLFLAPFAAAGPGGILAARLAQALLGALTAVVAWRFAAAALGRRSGLVAGALVCCDPFAVFLANLLLSEVLFTLLALGLTASAWRMLAPGRAGGPLAGLAVLGPAAVLTRPSAAAWLPLLWLLVAALAAERRRTLPRLLLCPLALGLALLPWGLRNRAALGAFAWLSTNGGATLYDAQGPQADGSSDQAFMQTLPELRGLDEVGRDRTLLRLALDQMARDPGRVLELAGVKLRRTWSLTPNVAEHRHGPAAWAGAAFTLVTALGALAGLARTVAGRRAPAGSGRLHALLWLPVAYFTLLHCVYVGSVRYRVPLMPFLAVAGATLVAPGTARHAAAPPAGLTAGAGAE